MIRFVFLAALFVGNAAESSTQHEEKRFEVNALNGSDFEVIRQQHMGAAELWCAAASYVEIRRGLSETTPIYLRVPLGPAQTARGRSGVIFSLSNAGLPPADPARVSLTIDAPGEMMKSAVARRYCRDAFTRSTK